MGLDMRLYSKSYVKNWEHSNIENQLTIDVHDKKTGLTKPHPTIDVSKISYITEDAAYWRKANAIHRWFEVHLGDELDNGREYWVTLEMLEELVATCREVLADHSKAEKLLPTTSGFFFGSTDYDEWYFTYLGETIRQLEPYLEKKIEGGYKYAAHDFYYSGDW